MQAGETVMEQQFEEVKPAAGSASSMPSQENRDPNESMKLDG